MKKIILFALLVAPAVALAQKIESKRTDKFTGNTTISTTRESVALQMGYAWVSVAGHIITLKDSTDTYILGFYLKGQRTGSLSPGKSSITLLLDNGETMEFPYEGEYKLFIPSDLIISMTCIVSKEQLEILSKMKVTDIRVMTDKRTDYEVKGKKQNTIADISKLLLSTKS